MELMTRYQHLHKHTYDAGLAADNEKEAAYIRSIQKTRMGIDGHKGRRRDPNNTYEALREVGAIITPGARTREEIRDALQDELDSL